MALRYTALSLLWHYLQRLPLTFDHFLTKFVLCLVCLWSLCAPLLSSFLSFHDRWRFNFLSRVFFLTTVTKSLLTALLGSLCTIVEIGTFHEKKKVRFSILLKKKFSFFVVILRTRRPVVERYASWRRWRPNPTWRWLTWSTFSATLQHVRRSWLSVQNHWSSCIQFWGTGRYYACHSVRYLNRMTEKCERFLHKKCVFCHLCLHSWCSTVISAPPQKTPNMPAWRRHWTPSSTTAASAHICNITWGL